MSNKELLEKFVAERNEALFSLDKNKIMAFAKKYNNPIAKERVGALCAVGVAVVIWLTGKNQRWW